MATRQIIKPFPADIDRNSFGHWLSGFADGEGSFLVRIHRSRFNSGRPGKITRGTSFRINIRLDDRPILETIQSFWGCGRIHDRKKEWKNPRWGRNAQYAIDDVPSLMNVVVPHFLRYPLRAKKAKDFAVWKDIVALVYQISQKPWQALLDGDRARRWTEEEKDLFARLALDLQAARRYVVPREIPKTPPPPGEEP